MLVFETHAYKQSCRAPSSRFLSLLIAPTEIYLMQLRLRSSSWIGLKRLALVPGSSLALFPGPSLVGFRNSGYLPIRRDNYSHEWELCTIKLPFLSKLKP
jgi:hypothetical protein